MQSSKISPEQPKKLDRTLSICAVVTSVAALAVSVLSGWEKITLWFDKSEVAVSMPERLHLLNHELCRPSFQVNVAIRNSTVSDLKLNRVELEVIGPTKNPILMRADLILAQNFNSNAIPIRGQKINSGDTWSGNLLLGEADQPGYRESAGSMHFLIQNSLEEYKKVRLEKPTYAASVSPTYPVYTDGGRYITSLSYAEVASDVKEKALKFCDENLARYLPGKYKFIVSVLDDKDKKIATTSYSTTVLEQNLEYVKVNFLTNILVNWGQGRPPLNKLTFTVAPLILESIK